MRLSKQDFSFHELLEAQADAAVRAAQAFHQLSRSFTGVAEQTRAIKQIETEADDITHQLANKISATFITPLDKEDLGILMGRLDDVTDAIEAAAGRILLYQLAEPRPDLEPFAQILAEVAVVLKGAVGALRQKKTRDAMQEYFIEIHRLENESDTLYRKCLGTLLNAPGADPIQVFKWKEIYDRIEIAVDSCEDVANAVESVVVKYA
jgi:predicted phosphate transport protein (TIGR00153 family)